MLEDTSSVVQSHRPWVNVMLEGYNFGFKTCFFSQHDIAAHKNICHVFLTLQPQGFTPFFVAQPCNGTHLGISCISPRDLSAKNHTKHFSTMQQGKQTRVDDGRVAVATVTFISHFIS